jgi:chromosome segregation ATPase
VTEPTVHPVVWAPSAIKDAVEHASAAFKAADGAFARVSTFELSALIDATRALIEHNEQEDVDAQELERLRQELGTIRGELADFAQESVPSHVPTLQAVRWLIAEHDGQVKHNEEIGEENRALCDERDQLAAKVERLRAGNAEYAKVFATWQSLWDEKEEWEKAAKEAWQRENVLAWLHAETRWLLHGMARRVGGVRRELAVSERVTMRVSQSRDSFMSEVRHFEEKVRRIETERDEALAALAQQQTLLARAVLVWPQDAMVRIRECIADPSRMGPRQDETVAGWGARAVLKLMESWRVYSGELPANSKLEQNLDESRG